MKKTILSFIGIAATVFAFGQSVNLQHNTSKVVSQDAVLTKTVATAPATSNNRASGGGNSTSAVGATLFHETFGAGLAGDGSNGTWTTNGTVGGSANANCVWEYRGTSTTPDVLTGSRGAWAGTSGAAGGAPVASTTAANGFMIFDSDYLDNGGSQTGAGTGVAPAPHKGWLVSPSFSTMGSNNIVINFTTYFRRYVGTVSVLLSNDNGATWGDSVVVFDNTWGVNDASALDLVINNEANFMANVANARIAFFFDGETESGSSGPGYYFAMVDDIFVSESPDNDLTLDGVFYRNEVDTGFTQYYTRVPVMLASFDTIEFSGNISNKGSVLQENVVFTNTVTSPVGVNVLTSPLNVNVASNTSDSLIASTSYVLDQGTGLYSWVFAVASDSVDDVPSNNVSDSVFVLVTDTTYGRDIQASGGWSFNSATSFEMGPLLDIYDTVKATSITVGIGTGSTVGEPFSVYIYDFNLDIANPIAKREFVLLTAADIDNVISVSIPETVLTPGQYFVTFKTYSDGVSFMNSSINADVGQVVVDLDADNDFGWSNANPLVRLNVSEDLFVCDLEVVATANGNNTADAVASLGSTPYSYEWDNGETTATATNLSSGTNHCVTVTDADACTATACVDIVSSVGDLGVNSVITLFPNPNTGNFQINMADVTAGNYVVTVKNYLGQTIYTDAVEVNGTYSGSINLDHVSKGVYFLELSNTNDEKSVIRFVVK